MRYFKVVLLIFVASTLGYAAIAATMPGVIKTPLGIQERSTSLDEITSIDDCTIHSWQEEVDIMGTCTYDYWQSCENETNTSCVEGTQQRSYDCVTGTNMTTLSEKICDTQSLIVNDILQLNTQEYECSYEKTGPFVIVTCDSRFDGNGDGICHSGESCMKFEINGASVTKYLRNSQSGFTEEDKSFFADEIEVEVLPK